MCCQSVQYMICPCCCHVLSPWLGKLGLMFGISGLLGMLLLHNSCNCLSYFLCCCLWSVLFCCGLIWSVSCLACICILFLLYFCLVFYVVCSWVGSMCLASWGIVYQCLMLHVYMVDWTMWCFFFFCFHIKTNGTVKQVEELFTNVWCYMFTWWIEPCDVSFSFVFISKRMAPSDSLTLKTWT